MENYIITEQVGKIKKIARDSLKDHWFKVAVGFLIIYLVSAGASTILDYFFSTSYRYTDFFGEEIIQKIPYGGSFYLFFVSGPITYGAALFSLTYFRRRIIDHTLIFEGFSHFLKAFLLTILIGIKVFLWSLLFIIPGVIAGIRYSQAFYILIDHPEYSAFRALKESCALMKNNKGKFFLLSLSFIGWSILAAIPNTLFLVRYTEIHQSLFPSIVSLVLMLPVVMVSVYMAISQIVFYELLTRNLVVNHESEFLEALNGDPSSKIDQHQNDDDLEKEEDTYSDEV